MITISKKYGNCFYATKFVIKATNPKSDNLKWRHVYCDGSWLYGTDAKRIHAINMDYYGYPNGFDRGFYEVIKNNANEILLNKSETLDSDIFPDVQKIIPEHSMLFNEACYTGEPICLSRIIQDFYVKCYTEGIRRVDVNLFFLEEAMFIGEDIGIWWQSPRNDPYNRMCPIQVKGLYNNFFSIIMPFDRSKDNYEVG